MPIENQAYARVRFNPLGNFVAKAIRHTEEHIGDLIGFCQVKAGYKPTIIRTPRMALEQWKHELRHVSPPSKGPILIAAIRNPRWIEWAVFSACYMLQMGYEPIVLYSNQHIRNAYGKQKNKKDLRNNFWEGVYDIPHAQFIDIDKFADQIDDNAKAQYADFAKKAAHTVAAYNLHIEEYEPDQAPGEYEQEVLKAEEMLLHNAIMVEKALRAHPAKRLICPSGLIGESLAYFEVAKLLNITGIYVEGWALRPGHMIWNVNQPALEYDIDGWMKLVSEWDDMKEADARDYMAFREGRSESYKEWLNNFHQVQRSPKENTLPVEVTEFLKRPGKFFLLGTNVVGDSSTLRRSTIFRSQEDWMQCIVEFFRQNSDMNLIIRAHPDEVWVNARLRLGEIAKKYAHEAPNILIIGGEQKVNTYSIIEYIDVGLAWVSNIGLDMAVRGKPVVMAASPKYTGLGVCHEPETKDAYFGLLQELASSPVSPDPMAIQRGKIYHYIVFKLMSLEADSKRYQSIDYRLGKGFTPPNLNTFYRILVGELSDKGQPLFSNNNLY